MFGSFPYFIFTGNCETLILCKFYVQFIIFWSLSSLPAYIVHENIAEILHSTRVSGMIFVAVNELVALSTVICVRCLFGV